MSKEEIVMYGPINRLGYGIFFTNILDKLVPIAEKEQVKVSAVLKSQPQVAPEEIPEAVKVAVNNGRSCSHRATGVNFWHLHDMMQFTGGRRIGYPVFEMPILSPPEVNSLANLDGILVCSRWARNVLEKYLDPADAEFGCQVVPGGVDADTFKPRQEHGTGPWADENYTTFVNVGKLEKRKGHDLLLDAMCILAAEHNKPVRLLMYCFNPFLPDFAATLKDKMGSRGFMLNDSDRYDSHVRFRHEISPNHCVIDVVTVANVKNDVVAEIYRSADYGIFPHFAEGWCLPLLECMASGVPVISTNNTGPSEYLNRHNHIEIQKTKEVTAADGIFFHGDRGVWHVPPVIEVAEKIASAPCKDEDKYKTLVAEGLKTVREFSWENAAKKLLEAVR